MKFLAIVAIILPLALADPIRWANQLRFDGKANNGSRIIGGVPATSGQIPYIISLRYVGGSHFCGGTSITTRTIVTAGHCVVGDSAAQLQIRYNTLTHASGGTLVQVSELHLHENYDDYDIDNDVAVLNLAAALDFSQPNAGAISLPAQGSDPAEGLDVVVSGWGTTSEGSGSLPAALQTVTVPIVGRTLCNQQYASFGGVTLAMICAGVTEGGKDACQGDSGGPLVANGQLLGATSWGYGCARPNYAGVYTRIGLFVDWINARTIA